ncbi:hypothetical protein TNCV_3898371 [Trichonephila clavipes]|nr:hypothetical protein TNCV_3898371 [Trichonephila clavipes]
MYLSFQHGTVREKRRGVSISRCITKHAALSYHDIQDLQWNFMPKIRVVTPRGLYLQAYGRLTKPRERRLNRLTNSEFANINPMRGTEDRNERTTAHMYL